MARGNSVSLTRRTPSKMSTTATVWAGRTLVLAAILASWQFLPQIAALRDVSPVFDPFFVSSPSMVLERVYQLAVGAEGQPLLWPFVADTLWATFIGVAVGTALGVVLGLLLGNSSMAQRIARPFVTILNAMPRIALVPIFVIIAGPTTAASVMTAVALVLLIVFYNAFAGATSVPDQVVDNARLLGASPVEVMLDIRLPYVLVWTFASLPNAISFGLVAVITAELLTGRVGLGQLLLTSMSNVDATLTFAVVAVAATVGVVLVTATDAVQRRVLHWWTGPR